MSAPPRLGRGLAALLGDAPDAKPPNSPPTISHVAIESLEPGPFQPRGDISPETLAELADSIRSRGILQPLLVRPHPTHAGLLQIIAGERRWRAAQQVGLRDVPVLIRDLPDNEAMAAALVENLQRQDLNAIEEAEGYRRLIDEFDMTQEQLGTALGKSRSHIANAIRLLHLPSSVRNHVVAGALSAGHARALLAHRDPERGAQDVIARGLNVRQTEAISAKISPPPSAGAKPDVDPETAALEQDLSTRLGLKVRISFDGGGGSMKIQYGNLDQLDGLVALLSRA